MHEPSGVVSKNAHAAAPAHWPAPASAKRPARPISAPPAVDASNPTSHSAQRRLLSLTQMLLLGLVGLKFSAIASILFHVFMQSPPIPGIALRIGRRLVSRRLMHKSKCMHSSPCPQNALRAAAFTWSSLATRHARRRCPNTRRPLSFPLQARLRPAACRHITITTYACITPMLD